MSLLVNRLWKSAFPCLVNEVGDLKMISYVCLCIILYFILIFVFASVSKHKKNVMTMECYRFLLVLCPEVNHFLFLHGMSYHHVLRSRVHIIVIKSLIVHHIMKMILFWLKVGTL